jgi:hypothetical protein
MRLGDGFPDSKGRSQTVSVTKADLITIIADKLKFPWARAELLVDVVFGCLEQSMSRGEKIEVRATRPNYPYTRECELRLRLRSTPAKRYFLRQLAPPYPGAASRAKRYTNAIVAG